MIESKVINVNEYNLKQREQFSSEMVIDKEIPHVLLATCNRTELYWGEGEVSMDIAEHLFRVASGLESALIGERAIQGQIKQAYQEASKKYHLSSGLNRLFQCAIHTGKRTRTETKISQGAVSHSQVAVDILSENGVDFQSHNIAVVGINKLNEDIFKFLNAKEAKNVYVFNRHAEKAVKMAAPYGYNADNLDRCISLLPKMDVLISATSAPYPIFKKENFSTSKKMIIIDLAFPRDIEEGTEEMSNITLYNLDTVEAFAQKNLKIRMDEVVKAEQIIKEELEEFKIWQDRSLQFSGEGEK